MNLGLEYVMTYRVKTTHPLAPTSGSPVGEHQYWTLSEAELEGPEIHARLAAPGMDWLRLGTDGFWRPNVRAAFKTDDEQIIWLHYSGLVQQTDAFKAAATANRETQWGDQYMRLALRFDTGAPRYYWLNTSLFVAAGRLLGTGHIEYSVHRVT
jgi:hypothetical protein